MMEHTAEVAVALAERSVPSQVASVAMRMVDCIRIAAEEVALDTGADRFDDANSKGYLRYRRARNRMRREFEDDEAVVADDSKNSLTVRAAGVAIQFYSSPHGIDQPSVNGATATQRRLLEEMQLTLELGPGVGAPGHLVLIHQCDSDGLYRAAVGLMATGSVWAWNVGLFDRSAAVDVPAEGAEVPSYDQQPESQIPPIRRRIDEDAADGDGRLDAS